MKRRRLLFPVLLASFAVTATAATLIKPTLLHPDEGPAFVPALRLTSDASIEREFGRPDRSVVAEYELAVTLSTKPKINPEKAAFDLRGGFEWRLDPVKPVGRRFSPNPNQGGTTPSPSTPRSNLRWGSISAEAAAAFETDEPLDNRQWAYGVRANYTPAFDRADSQWWTPHLWIEYRRIEEIGSTLATKIGVPKQKYWRFGSQVFWQINVPAWRGLKIIPGFQYYRSTDLALALEARDLDDAYNLSLAFDYAIPESSSWGQYFSAVRLEVADGRVPPATISRTSVALAFTVRWDQLLK